jgi:hypothetical protein
MITKHAVVVVGIDQEHGLMYINDPFFADAPLELLLAEFEAGWIEGEGQYAVINDAATFTFSGVIFGVLPPNRSRARAARNPASVRPRIRSRLSTTGQARVLRLKPPVLLIDPSMGYPLTEPRVSPEINWRCIKRKTRMIGNAVRKAPAITMP